MSFAQVEQTGRSRPASLFDLRKAHGYGCTYGQRLMAGDPDIAALNRTMKDVASSLKEMTRVLTALNANVVGIYKNLSEGKEKVVQKPRTPWVEGSRSPRIG